MGMIRDPQEARSIHSKASVYTRVFPRACSVSRAAFTRVNKRRARASRLTAPALRDGNLRDESGLVVPELREVERKGF